MLALTVSLINDHIWHLIITRGYCNMLQHSSGNRLLHAAYCMLLHVGQPIAKVLQIIKAPRRGGKFVAGRLQLASCKSVLSILVQATTPARRLTKCKLLHQRAAAATAATKWNCFFTREKSNVKMKRFKCGGISIMNCSRASGGRQQAAAMTGSSNSNSSG